MLTTEQLQRIAQEKTDQLKKNYRSKGKLSVDYTPVYQMSIDQRDRIRVHAEEGVFPERLFKKRAPNQTEIEAEYLEANFKSVTMPVWERFMSVLSRIWSDQNWKIDFNGNEPAKEYLESGYPIYGSLESYFKDVITTNKELDNNGVVALQFYQKFEEDITKINTSERESLSPVMNYIECGNVIDYKEGVYAAIITELNSLVEFGGKRVNEGIVIDIYDDTNIYRMYQVGIKVDFTFEVVLYYNHQLEYLPVKKLNGKVKPINGNQFYQSAFIGAVPALDQALLDESYLVASKAKCAYPRGWEYTSDCDYSDESGHRCIAGQLKTDIGDIQCPSCMGTGTKRPGILGIHQIKIPEFGGSTSALPSGAPFGWVAPSTETLQFLRSEIDNGINKGASILNILISNSDVKGGDTALGKQIDREELFSFIKRISDQIFELFEFSNNTIIKVREGKEAELPTIGYPRTFAIRSDFDLTEEISKAKSDGLPASAIKKLVEEWILTRFGTDSMAQSIMELIYSTDRIWELTNDDVIKFKVSGTIATWECILHTSIETFIEQSINLDSRFIDKSKTEQQQILIGMAKLKDLEINPPAVNIDTVLGSANQEVNDKEAEAAANLRGSVGGSQVIIDLVGQVSAGTMDRTAAINTLIFLFKIDEEQATKLLGPIKKIDTSIPNANA